MESTALILLALSAKLSCMGVMFGWQPMPDGSDKVEYIVQIEPELAATLREGQSIPITSDIPSDIGPIGRIRIEVGRNELPREGLATRFKPWPADAQKKSREGLVETQFTAPASNASGSRYDTAGNNGTILPPGSNQQAASNSFGQALQQGAQQARNAVSNAADQILPPSSDQLFGSGSEVQNNLRQGFQRNVEQVADRTGQQLRQAVNNVGQRASNAVDEFGRSLTSNQSDFSNRQASNDSTILPPATNNAVQATNPPQFNDSLQPRRQQPKAEVPSSSFASSAQAGSNPTSQRGDFSAPWPPTTTGQAAPPTTLTGNDPSRYGTGQQAQANPPAWPSQQQNQQANPRVGFDIADRQNGNPRAGDASYGQQNYLATNNDMRGPELTMPSQQQSNQPSNLELTSQVRTGPAVTRTMLPEQQRGAMQNGGVAAGYPQQQVTARQPLGTQPLGTQPRDFGWNQNGQQQDNSDKTVFPMLLSWVFLSGSVVSNFYLFWSYMDVRNKYRGVVHGTPVRRDRYDD